MAPKCDRCYLGWNGVCCEFTEGLDLVITQSPQFACEELGFYEVPLSLQIKRINCKIRQEKTKEVEN